jgi:hypothetical protein
MQMAAANQRDLRAHAADRHVNQPRMQLAQFIEAQAEPLHGARTEILHQNIRLPDQLRQHLSPDVGLDIDRERALATIRGNEQRREIPGLVDGLAAAPVMSPLSGSILSTSAP